MPLLNEKPNCAQRIVKASKGFFSEKEAEKLLKELQEETAKYSIRTGSEFGESLSATVLQRSMKVKKEAQRQEKNALINMVKDKELYQKLTGFVNGGMTLRKAFQAVLVGVSSNVKEGRLSVDAQYKQLLSGYMGNFTRDMEKEGLLPLINQRAMQVEVSRELWELSLKNPRPGVTGSKEAQKIAGIIHKYMEAVRLRQNRAGADIKKTDGYIGVQTHDAAKISKEGFERWRDTVLPLLDQQRTFQGEFSETFLQQAYIDLSNGKHLRALGMEEGAQEPIFQFKGPGNLAKKVSQSRVLHFKTVDDWHVYNNKYGRRDFMEGIFSYLDRGARSISLMETFGPNPGAMFDRQLNNLKERYNHNPKIIGGLAKNDRPVRNFFEEVSGAVNMVESPNLSTIGSTLRAVQTMSKLGATLVSSISDIPLKAAELQFHGFGIMESYGIPLKNIFEGRGNSERRQLAAMMGVGFESMAGSITARFSSMDDLPGRMSKLMRLYFKLNHLSWWTDSQKIGTGMALSNRVARFKGKQFSALPEDMRRIFGTFGIQEKDWNIIRQSAVKELDKRYYITPDAIQDLPDHLFTGTKHKEELEGKLRAYFIDAVDRATLTPDARERAIIHMGTKKGTVEGEFLRLMGQFKSFPISVLTKIYGRALYGKGRADIPALVQTAIMTTLFGYIAMTGKDALKGRAPRDATEFKTWVSAFSQGGGAGIIGDFILGEYNRFGQTFTTTLAGPTFGTVDEFARTLASIHGSGDTKAKMINFVINNTPGANLYWLRPALNYMAIYHLQEWANPGYLRRMEKRVEQENNQRFIVKPSSVLK